MHTRLVATVPIIGSGWGGGADPSDLSKVYYSIADKNLVLYDEQNNKQTKTIHIN